MNAADLPDDVSEGPRRRLIVTVTLVSAICQDEYPRGLPQAVYNAIRDLAYGCAADGFHAASRRFSGGSIPPADDDDKTPPMGITGLRKRDKR